MSRKIAVDRAWLVRAYETRTAREIADDLGCSIFTVLRNLRAAGVPIKTAHDWRRQRRRDPTPIDRVEALAKRATV